jgi:diacylglycerol kinase (ATP)
MNSFPKDLFGREWGGAATLPFEQIAGFLKTPRKKYVHMVRLHMIGNRRAPKALAYFRSQGHEVVELTATDTRGSIAAIQNAIVTDGALRMVVVGGDGMVHAAANAIAPLGAEHPGVVLGIIALGSGNDFARALGLVIDDELAAAKACLEPAKPVDLLETSFGWVATVATCGFPARVNRRANSMRYPKGSLKYTVATVAVLPSLGSDVIELSLDGAASTQADLHLLAIGNTAYFGGGMKICPDASFDDGLAEVVQVDTLGRLEVLRFLPSVFPGKHVHNVRTKVQRARTISLRADSNVELWGDGECLGVLPATVELRPNAIQVAGLV